MTKGHAGGGLCGSTKSLARVFEQIVYLGLCYIGESGQIAVRQQGARLVLPIIRDRNPEGASDILLCQAQAFARVPHTGEYNRIEEICGRLLPSELNPIRLGLLR